MMVKIGIIDGKKLSGPATAVIAVSNSDGSEEQTDAEDRLLHAQSLPAQPEGVQVKNCPSQPDPYDSLGSTKLIVGFQGFGGDSEKGS